MVLNGFVLLGGVKRIGAVAEKLVPAMCIGYIVASLVVLGLYAEQIPAAFALIFKHAFTPLSATGGFAGATIMLAMRYGVARGIFSNEAGLGTAGIAQAAGQTKSAAESGLVGMMGTFIDTIVVCTMTGLVLSAKYWESTTADMFIGFMSWIKQQVDKPSDFGQRLHSQSQEHCAIDKVARQARCHAVFFTTLQPGAQPH